MTKYVAAIGNAFDGINLYGPFDTVEDAAAFAEINTPDYSDWNIVPLETT